MKRNHLALLAAVLVVGVGVGVGAIATADPTATSKKGAKKRRAKPAAPPTAADVAAAKIAFGDVFQVLMSPRCMNCHPSGDRPLQSDDGVAHAMNISRASEQAGLPCSTCHSDRNSEDTIGLAGGPPGAAHWGLPPKATPMRFQGHSPSTLCQQLRDPSQNGKRSLADLLHHVQHDGLVLWGWNPGGDRTKPPISHAAFVDAFKRWTRGGGACPVDGKP